MSDSQPIASIEPIPPVAEVGVPGTASAIPTVVVESSVLIEANSSRPAERSAQAEDVAASWLWLNKYDQMFVVAFAAVFLALGGYHWATLGGWGMRPIELDRLPARQYDFRIDINTASWVEWTQIEGIGELTAQKIIDDRQANGPFRSMQDLLRVKGIGPKTLEKMQPFLREPSEQSAPAKSNP